MNYELFENSPRQPFESQPKLDNLEQSGQICTNISSEKFRINPMSIRHCLPITAVALNSRATTNPTTIQRLIMLVPGQMHYVSEKTSKTLVSISEPHSPTWLHSLPPSPHSSSSPPLSHILPLLPFCSTSNYLNCIMWKFNQLWRSYKVLFNCNFYPCLWKYLQPTGSDRNLHEDPSLQGKLRGLLSRSLNWSSQNFPQNRNMILPWVWTKTMTTWRLVMLIPNRKHELIL